MEPLKCSFLNELFGDIVTLSSQNSQIFSHFQANIFFTKSDFVGLFFSFFLMGTLRTFLEFWLSSSFNLLACGKGLVLTL